MPGWLAGAYAASAVVPADLGGVPAGAALAHFHLCSAAWYACRWRQVRLSGRKGVQWYSAAADDDDDDDDDDDADDAVVVPAPLSRAQLALCAGSAVLQYPLFNPAAAAAPFVLSCLLGVPATSNVLLLVQGLALCAALLFEGSLLLPLGATVAALAGFGETAARATPRAFAWTTAAHCACGAAAVALHAWKPTPPGAAAPQGARLAQPLSAALGAVLCAEARVRAATRPGDPRAQVVWACRAAALGSACTLTFRVVAAVSGRAASNAASHVASAGLAALVLCAPWQWQMHAAWRRRGERQVLRGTPTAVALVTAAAVASLLPVV